MATPTKNTVPTEAVVELSPDATPFKNTVAGKTTRTLLQNAAGALLVIIPVLVASDELRGFVGKHPEYGWIPVALAVAGALATYLQNAYEDKVISDQSK